VSFETIVPSVEEFAARIQNSLSAWTWLISHRGQGVGSQLYRRLFTDLASLGYCNAYAGVTQPNEASMALHRGVGFEYIGTFRSVGRKFDRWHDVAWFQRKLRETPLGVP
jgi:phosphinothricin acetyltransferase